MKLMKRIYFYPQIEITNHFPASHGLRRMKAWETTRLDGVTLQPLTRTLQLLKAQSLLVRDQPLSIEGSIHQTEGGTQRIGFRQPESLNLRYPDRARRAHSRV